MSEDEQDEAQERAARVRDRRSRRGRRTREEAADTEQSEVTTDTPQTEQKSQNQQTEKTSQIEGTSQTAKQQSIKERKHDTFYLRDDLRRELRRVTGQSNLDFEMTFGTELEKNRHLRPLLLYLGAQQLESMTPDEIRNILDRTDVLDSIDVNE